MTDETQQQAAGEIELLMEEFEKWWAALPVQDERLRPLTRDAFGETWCLVITNQM